MDVPYQISGHNACGCCRPKSRKRRPHGPYGVLYWKYPRLSISKIWTQRGKKERNIVSSLCGRSIRGFWSTHRRSSLFVGGSQLLFSFEDLVEIVLQRSCGCFCITIYQSFWERALGFVLRRIQPTLALL